MNSMSRSAVDAMTYAKRKSKREENSQRRGDAPKAREKN